MDFGRFSGIMITFGKFQILEGICSNFGEPLVFYSLSVKIITLVNFSTFRGVYFLKKIIVNLSLE